MNIYQAMAAVSKRTPFITRAAWRGVVTAEPVRWVIKIQPTNTPSGCIVHDEATKILRPGWQPRAEDLMADDWETVAG